MLQNSDDHSAEPGPEILLKRGSLRSTADLLKHTAMCTEFSKPRDNNTCLVCKGSWIQYPELKTHYEKGLIIWHQSPPLMPCAEWMRQQFLETGSTSRHKCIKYTQKA